MELNAMTERTVSARETFVMKFMLPIVWIFGFGAGTIAIFLGVMRGQGNQPPPEDMKWQFLAMWMIGSAGLVYTCAPLKRVRIASDAIYISNYLKEIRVPFEEIIDVTENRWLNLHPVTIHFRVPTAFGDRIFFMPPKRWFGWRRHPLVNELRDLAHLSRPDDRKSKAA
jgi:hypothetical protein